MHPLYKLRPWRASVNISDVFFCAPPSPPPPELQIKTDFQWTLLTPCWVLARLTRNTRDQSAPTHITFLKPFKSLLQIPVYRYLGVQHCLFALLWRESLRPPESLPARAKAANCRETRSPASSKTVHLHTAQHNHPSVAGGESGRVFFFRKTEPGVTCFRSSTRGLSFFLLPVKASVTFIPSFNRLIPGGVNLRD